MGLFGSFADGTFKIFTNIDASSMCFHFILHQTAQNFYKIIVFSKK